MTLQKNNSAPSFAAFNRDLPVELDLYAPVTASLKREQVVSMTSDSEVFLGGMLAISDRAHSDAMYSAVAHLLWGWRESGAVQRIGILDICAYTRAAVSAANNYDPSTSTLAELADLRADLQKKIYTLADDISVNDITVVHGLECLVACPPQSWISDAVKELLIFQLNICQAPWLGTAVVRDERRLVETISEIGKKHPGYQPLSYITFAPERSAE